MYIDYSTEFSRRFKKLPIEVKMEAVQKEKLFRKDPFYPSLKTHKLSGNLKGRWAFSVSYKYRIIFAFIKEKYIVFHTIGKHDIYK